MFLEVGLAISPGRLLDSIGPIAWAIGAILVGRAVIVYVLLGGASRLAPRPGLAERVPAGWLHVLFWAGLRGAVAVAMALSLPVDIAQRDLLQEITFGVVLFTLLVQGTTVGPLIDRAIGPDAGSGSTPPGRTHHHKPERGPPERSYRRRYNPCRSDASLVADLRRPVERRISSISWR